MPAHRSAGALMSVAVLLIVCLWPAFSQTSESGVRVQAIRPGVIETKPLNPLTLVFRAINRTEEPHYFSPHVELPEGWNLVVKEPAFKLEGGEETIRLVSVFVPDRAMTGDYRVGYAVSALDDPALAGRAEAEVRVLLEVRLAVEAMDVHHLVVAGDIGRAEFLVTNRSNAPLDVDLDLKSNGPHVSQDVKKMRLEAGESRSVGIAVSTDPGLSRKLNQHVQLRAEAKVPEKGAIAATAMTEFEVIPRVSGKGDYFNKLPAEIGLLALATGGAQKYGQFKLSGAGSLDREGNHQLDFLLRGPGRGPGREAFYQFGLQREEYRLSYRSPHVNVHVGDRVFSLTPLTETGNYGRGLEAEAASDKWSVRGYFERILLLDETGNEKAFQLGYKPGEKMKFNLSYLTRKDPERPAASRIFSLQSQLIHKSFHLNLEYSWDWAGLRGFRPANSALWVEAGQTHKKFNFQVNIIRSGPEYHGYYNNLDYTAAGVSYANSERWGLRASFLAQKRHTAIEPYLKAFYGRTIQAGAYYQAFRRLCFSLDQRVHERQDLSGEAVFDYRDTSLRLGAFTYFGTFSFQNFVDIGRTYNRLTRESEKLTEYSVSASYLAINKISLTAYLHYRGQNESFTGDKIRRLDMNFSAGLRMGRIDVNAFFRTAILQDLYQSALSREDFEDPVFLLNTRDMFGMSLKCRFRNDHSLGFRVQRVANPFMDGLPAKSTIGLIEYSIPVGFPVSRKMTVGMLRGMVYDTEKGRQGVPGVILKVNDLAAVTNPKGEYVFNGLSPGSYVLTLDDRREGSDMVTVEKMPLSLAVEGGKRLDVPIGLTAGSSIGGRVVVYSFENNGSRQLVRMETETQDPSEAGPGGKGSGDDVKLQLAEGAPHAGAEVELRGEDEIFQQITDEQGRFLFKGLRAGTYTLKVFDDHLPELHVFEQDAFEFDLTPGAKEEITIRVVPVIRTIQIIDQGEVKIKKK